MWPLCFADEGRSAVDAAGGAQIVAEHIKSLAESTDPATGKLLTVFCGMLMNYSNDNGNDRSPKTKKAIYLNGPLLVLSEMFSKLLMC